MQKTKVDGPGTEQPGTTSITEQPGKDDVHEQRNPEQPREGVAPGSPEPAQKGAARPRPLPR